MIDARSRRRPKVPGPTTATTAPEAKTTTDAKPARARRGTTHEYDRGRRRLTPQDRHDVLVIGGGPAGAAAAYWLADAGHDVVVRRDASASPARRRAATGSRRGRSSSSPTWACTTASTEFHRFDGLRAVAHDITLELRWPQHPVFPDHGFVVRRRDLDQFVAEQAVKAGATLHQGTEAVRPLARRMAWSRRRW